MKKILKSWPFKNTTCVLWPRTWLVNQDRDIKKNKHPRRKMVYCYRHNSQGTCADCLLMELLQP